MKTLLKKYQLFIEKVDSSPFDLMMDRSDPGIPAYENINRKKLKFILSNNANCRIAIWKMKQNEIPVWLDIETNPNGPFCFDLETLFQIIPYGSGYIYDQLNALFNGREEIIITPKIDKEILGIYEEVMSLKVSRNPYDLIVKSFYEYKGEWEFFSSKIK